MEAVGDLKERNRRDGNGNSRRNEAKKPASAGSSRSNYVFHFIV